MCKDKPNDPSDWIEDDDSYMIDDEDDEPLSSFWSEMSYNKYRPKKVRIVFGRDYEEQDEDLEEEEDFFYF